jgi:uncharacterized protein (TIGR02284 family)
MFDRDDEVSAVNSLITTLIDSMNGYRDAAEHAESASFQQLFRSMADDRATVIEDLRAAVSRAGGEAADDGSLLGQTHQRFLDLKAALTGRDDKAIINEVERGEDYLKGKFEAALSTKGMSPETTSALERARESVFMGHAKISELKHALEH